MAIAIGSGQFGLEAAGTDQHQDELEQMAGGRTEAGVDHLCGALLVPNPKNPYDPNAIAVVINSLVVGYVPSNIAPSLKYALRIGGYIAAGCAAKIVGGWARADGNIGDFSVRLDADWPFKLRPIAKQETPAAPPPMFSAPPAFTPQPRPTPPPVAAPPVATATPRVEARPFVDEDEPPVHDLIEEPRRKRSIVAILIELALIGVLLGAGYWWVQRLPRDPQPPPPSAAPAAPAPAEPAPPPEPQPFQWPDPPPQFQAPPQAAPPPGVPPTAGPQPAPAPEPPPAPPPAAKKPVPKKPAAPKEPKAPPPNAPLKIN